MEINLISSKDSNETRTMQTKSDNTEIMICDETDGIIKSLLQKFQEGLEKSMKGN